MSDGAEARRARLSTAKRELLMRRLRGDAGSAQPAIPRAPRDRALPLSFDQERLWFLDRLGLGAAYNMGRVLRLCGPLDVDALQQSLDAVVARHEVLRTGYPEVDGEPFQEIHPPARLALEFADLSEVSAGERDPEVRRHWEEHLCRPFDLSQGAPLRVGLLRLTETEHVLLVALHHIAGDEWSQHLLQTELFALYFARANGQAAGLPELAVQYADFAAWQRDRMTPEVIEEQLGFWTRRLADLPTLEIPLDHVRPPAQTFAGDSVDFLLSQEQTRDLLALGRAQSVTTATLLISGFCVLLGRYSRQDDVVVGSPVTNRPQPELEALIGFFVSTVVMRADLSGDPTFAEVLRRMQATTIEAQQHQDLPLERIVEALHPEPDLSRNPLFQVLFAMMPEGGAGGSDAAAPGGLEIRPVAVDSALTRFDLELTAGVSPEGIAGRFLYNTDLFEHSTIERLCRHFQALLAGVVAHPDTPLSQVPMLLEDERRLLQDEWNDTARDYPRDALVQGRFEQRAARAPDAPAVVFEDRVVTYRELDERANQLAQYLVRRGVGPDVLVALCLERSVEMVVGILGILKAGGAYLPIDPVTPDERIVRGLEDANVAFAVTSPEVHARLGDRIGPAFTFGTHDAELDALSPEAPQLTLVPESLAYTIYTSGSTGRPKGVEISHSAALNFLESMEREPGLGEADVLLSVTTLSFDIAVLELFLPLSVGARVVLASRDDALDGEALARQLADHDVTVMQATPTTWRLLLQADWSGDGRLRALVGGEAWNWDLAAALLERCGSVWNMYGPTEATVWCAVRQVRPDDGRVLMGRPIANTQLHVLDSNRLPVPVGVPGELYLGGEQLARGYLAQPDLTAERFAPDPFGGGGERLYRAGDLVRYRADGSLEFLGRTDHQVKPRGYRIEPAEIELALAAHEAVRAAVVQLWDEGSDHALLVGFVVPAEGASATMQELKAHLAQRLPQYMVPDVLMPLDSLPRTANGKLDRKALPRPQATRDDAVEFVAPESPIELELAEIWLELLPVERVGLHDSLFDLGGHSLRATRLVSRTRNRFDLELPLRTVFDAPTLGGMSQEVLRFLLADEPGGDDLERERAS